MLTRSGGSGHITMPNFLEAGLSKAEILWFFSIFKLATATILDFWNHEILSANGVQRVEMHQRAKYRQYLSIGCKDINSFQFFNMAATIISDCQICDISLADSVLISGSSLCWMSSKLVVPLGTYCDFSNFHNGSCCHLEFLTSENFISYWVQRVVTHQHGKPNIPCHVKFHQNWSDVRKDIVKVWIFHTFGMKTVICTLFAVFG